MSENKLPDTTPELDFDAWLAGGERTTHYVPLYTRFDIIADIEELEKQRVPFEAPEEGDESLGGETDPNTELNAKIDELYEQIHASKREFRVTAITLDEHEAIKAQVLEELSSEIDAAAAKGREEARKTADRMGIKAVNDINGIVRVGANEKTRELITHEVTLRKVAAATTTRFNGEWRPLSVDQVRALHKAVGDAQINMLSEAALSASNDVPEVTIPKS